MSHKLFSDSELLELQRSGKIRLPAVNPDTNITNNPYTNITNNPDINITNNLIPTPVYE